MPVITAPNSSVGLQHRQGDVAEPSPPGGAVDLGGLVDLLGDGLETGQEDHHQGAEGAPHGHHDQRRQRQRGAVEPPGAVDADPAEHGVEEPAVVPVEELPDDRDRDDAGDHRKVVAHPEEALGVQDPVHPDRHRERDRHAERDAEHEVEQRVQGDLAEQRVRDQVGVVGQAHELHRERVAHVGALHVREAHPEAGEHRPEREGEEEDDEREGEHPRGDSLLPPRGVDVPDGPHGRLGGHGEPQRPVPMDDAWSCMDAIASSTLVSPTGGLLGLAVDDSGDLLPGRDGGRGLGAVELLAEDGQLLVGGELTGLPRGLHRREIADLGVEVLLHVGLGEPLDELPGVVLVVGVAEDRQVTTADEGGARAVGAGKQGDRVLVGAHARVLDQPGVPGAGDEGAVGVVGEPALELTGVQGAGR